jgi:putative transposase
MRTELVQSALDMAVARRRPEAGLVHHTDHAGQYTALTFGHELRKHGIEPSMGRVKTCYDNAVAESFFATLQKDLVNRCSLPPATTLRQRSSSSSKSGTTTTGCTAPSATNHLQNTS